MDAVDALTTYFWGEKATGLALLPVGLLILAAAFATWRTLDGSFMVGLTTTMTVIGLAFVAVGAGLAWKTDGQVAALLDQHALDAPAMVSAELSRMTQVNANWPRLKIAWLVLAVLSGLAVLLVKKDAVQGVAVVLFAAAALVMTLDVFAERRALVYTDALGQAAEHDRGPGAN